MRFEILGPIRVSGHTREIAITAGRDRTLLAMLLLHANQAVTPADLVYALWSGDPPRNARNQLQGCVSRLRKQLTDGTPGNQVIVTEPEGYRLRAGAGALDLLEFRTLVAEAQAIARDGRRADARDRYRAALGLWRGPALAGLDRGQLQHLAMALDEERTTALEECLDLELALGGAGELVSELTSLAHQYPYRERLHAALMLALYRSDRQADALAAYQRARHTLVADLGQEPGPALRELHRRILAGDQPRAPAKPAGSGRIGPKPSTAANHHLPRTVVDFTGRDADLTWLIEAAERADPYAPLVFAIDGMPGVGKTSLAVHAAHRLAPRYPDGQLFVDLRGHSEHRPMEPAAALDALLRQLGVPAAHIPTELDERIGRWRTELAGRQVLVVLDNAADSAQVAPLLPASAGCLTLVTGRRRLVDLDGAQPLSVGTLDPAEAATLLARVAGSRVRDEPAAAAEVAKRCGHLPLALRLAAARLAHRPGWQVRDLADRLADPGTPLAELTTGDRSVADAFALSYGQLAPAAQRMFRLLGLHPGEHFDDRVTAALADLSLADAVRLLDELVDGHLVEEPHPHRYQLHDLVKAYSSELATTTDPQPDRLAAVERMLDYYLHAAAAVSADLESPVSRRNFDLDQPKRSDLVEDSATRGGRWLDAEWPNVVAAVVYAAKLGFDRYTWQITRAAWQFLFTRGLTDSLVETHHHGLAAAERLADADASAMMHNYLASAYYLASRYDEAVEHVRHAVARREETGDLAGLAIARKNLAVVYSFTGRLDEATREIEQSLAIARRSGSPNILASVVANAGASYLIAGRYQFALECSRHGLVLASEVGDNSLRAITLGNIGSSRARLGEHVPALRVLTGALCAKRRYGVRYGEGETLNDLGMVCRLLGRLDEALTYHRQALTIAREVGDPQGEYAVYNEFGRTLFASGDTAGALEVLQRALDGSVRIRHPYGQARALDGLGACLRDTDPDSARRHWLRALRLYRELDVPEQHEVERQLDDLPGFAEVGR